uniref:ATP synthase F0 subunit 8 n=1 Tax=Aurelia coerulea TaxID=1962980 RepID=A0A6G7KUZ9_9CNID|nr:ATP synthase F0 subunit 8 [Aurelia coerulea]QII89159.1 ATP synthase F0 subunit 8 [Aurelia coerulea]
MPQLDVVTFVNQYVWIIGSVSVVVIIMLSVILPSIKKLTQIRGVTEEEIIESKEERDFTSFKKLISL